MKRSTPLSIQYKWIALSNTTLGSTMSSLDGNIVLIALPTIGRELPNTSPFDLLWVLIGYQLVVAVLVVNFGRLSDMFGRVRLYTLGFVLFTIGSAFCSLSQSGLELVAFRMIQGIGASFLLSNSSAIITDAFPLEERGRALGANAASVGAGSVLGLVLGGFLTSVAGWRSVFWVNIPIGIVASVWSYYRLRELSARRTGQKLDVGGNITFAGGLSMLLIGISLYAVSSLNRFFVFGLIGSGLVILMVFVFLETKSADPMLNFRLFKNRLFAAGNVASLLVALARGCVTLVLVFYLQGPGMNLDPVQAGIFLLPITATVALGPISGWLSDKRGPRLIASVGLLITASGLLILTQLPVSIGFWQLALPLALVGIGWSMFQSPNRASVMGAVNPEDRGIAASLNVTMGNIGMSVSRSLAFLVMGFILPLTSLDLLFAGSYAGVGSSLAASLVDGIHLVFVVSTVFIFLALIPSLMRERPGVIAKGDEAESVPTTID